MKILLIGAGGREHALAWKLAQSPSVAELLVAPGSDGIAQEPKTQCLREIAATDVERLVDLAARERPDLTVVGPEAPLVAGVADRFREKGLKIFGPSAAAARLEGSKAFAKSVMQRREIPTARYGGPFSTPEAAWAFASQHPETLWVVKADGLASGKGVMMPALNLDLPQNPEYIKADLDNRIRVTIKEHRTILLEELLAGEEASVIGISDGKRILALESAQDHKRIHEGDTGPNTGGMGAYSPAPIVTPSLASQIQKEILEKTVVEMSEGKIPFSGALYAGLMVTDGKPTVLEYNARFGDPETQVILPRLKTDLAELLLASTEERLHEVNLEWDSRACVTVVLASAGYPGSSHNNDPIDGLEQLSDVMPDITVFHAGTRRKSGKWVTAGGRVLNVTASGANHQDAVQKVYKAVQMISFYGMQVRQDIGLRAISRSAS